MHTKKCGLEKVTPPHFQRIKGMPFYTYIFSTYLPLHFSLHAVYISLFGVLFSPELASSIHFSSQAEKFENAVRALQEVSKKKLGDFLPQKMGDTSGEFGI